MNKIQKAFTLLELLVVIGIIGILLAFVTVGFTSAQKQGRDTRRKTDLAAIQNALEQYYSQNSFAYPNNCVGGAGVTAYFTGGVVPTDPLSPTQVYTWACSATSYTVTATLEKDGTPLIVRNLQ